MPSSASQTSESQIEPDGVELFADAISVHFEEIEEARAICKRHEATAAIHDRGQALQIYRMYKRDDEAATCLRTSTDILPTWEKSALFCTNGKTWKKSEAELNNRMKKNPKLLRILTQGVLFEDMPILIHAYKFDDDTHMKIELIPQPVMHSQLPINLVASVLRCHEFLVPEHVAKPLPPYSHHEARFSTIWEYLERTMPADLYTTECLPKNRALVSSGAQ